MRFSAWIRADYRFESLAAKMVKNNWVILPECTGIWGLRSSWNGKLR